MFPVKRAGQGREIARGVLTAVALALAACGYRPAYGGAAPEQRLDVVAAPTHVPNAEALQATLAGVRAELSSAGSLRPGGGYPRVVVELVRVDEASSGIAATPLDGETIPLARGSAVAVVGRAWVEEDANAPPARDTGDVRRVVRYAASPDPRVEQQRHFDALRRAARDLGRALGRRVLGEPEPADEAL